MNRDPSNVDDRGTTAIWSLVVTILCVFCVGAFSKIWIEQFNREVHWKSFFDQKRKIGQTCVAASGSLADEQNIDRIINDDHHFIEFSVPYRDKQDPPPFPKNGYLLIKCEVDLSANTNTQPGWVNLGPLFGKTWVYLNDRLRAVQNDDGVVEFPLLPQDLRTDARLTILSLNNAEGRPGPASLQPMFVASERATFAELRLISSAWRTEHPIFRVGYDAGLLILFSLIWYMGFRYAGVGWMIIFTSLLLLKEYLQYNPLGHQDTFGLLRLTSFINFVIALALPSLLIRIFKTERHSFSLEWAFFFLVGICASGVANIGQDLFWHYQMLDGLPSYFAAALLSLSCVWAFWDLLKKRGTQERRTGRLAVFLVFMVIAAGIYCAQALQGQRLGIFLAAYPLHAIATAFAVFLIIDIIMMQRYFEAEKALRLAEQRKHQIDKAIANYTRTIAHDVRGPLRLAGSYLSSLSDAADSTGLKNYVAKLQSHLEKNIMSVESMLADIMVAGSDSLPKGEVISLSDILSSCLQNALNLRPNLEAVGKLRMKHLKMGLAHKFRFERCVANILDNALQAMPKSGSITITTKDDDLKHEIHVAIHNTGSYISPERIEAIFTPYFTEGKAQGTGLGLTIAKDFLESIGGSITCSSDESSGTTFDLIIPASEKLDHVTGFSEVRAHAIFDGDFKYADSTKPKMLVVDDNIYVLDSWRQTTRDAQLVLMQSPTEVFQSIEQGSLLLTDLKAIVVDLTFANDTQYSGESFAIELRRRGYTGPIFMMSNASAESTRFMTVFTGSLEKRPYQLADILTLTNAKS